MASTFTLGSDSNNQAGQFGIFSKRALTEGFGGLGNFLVNYLTMEKLKDQTASGPNDRRDQVLGSLRNALQNKEQVLGQFLGDLGLYGQNIYGNPGSGGVTTDYQHSDLYNANEAPQIHDLKQSAGRGLAAQQADEYRARKAGGIGGLSPQAAAMFLNIPDSAPGDYRQARMAALLFPGMADGNRPGWGVPHAANSYMGTGMKGNVSPGQFFF